MGHMSTSKQPIEIEIGMSIPCEDVRPDSLEAAELALRTAFEAYMLEGLLTDTVIRVGQLMDDRFRLLFLGAQLILNPTPLDMGHGSSSNRSHADGTGSGGGRAANRIR